MRLTPIRRFDWWLRGLAWPPFDCIDCIGAGCGYGMGCYCDYNGGVAPCEPPGESHEWLRWFHGFLFLTTSPFWKDLDNAHG